MTSDSDDVPSIANGTHTHEDGYSSDCSGLSSWRRQSSELMLGKRVRKTRQTLDSNRNSVVIDDDNQSDTDVDEIMLTKPRKNEQRKKRVKNARQKSGTYDNRENNDSKRRSWTDSGVSLSRTDQSRCGTFENDVFATKKTQHILDNKKDIEDEYVVPLRTSTTSQSRKSFNRLSQITTRSSLTNVSIMTANSMTSLSSMSESELEYFSESSSDSLTSLDNIGDHQEMMSCGSQLSVTSSTSTIKEDEGEEVNDPQSYIDSQLKLYQELANRNKASTSSSTFVPQNSTPQPVMKRNSLIKRVKAHFKPHHKRTNKNYTDVSSEFSFEKVEKSKENSDQYEIITTDVLKRLHEEESGKLDFYVDDIYYEDDLTDDDERVEECKGDSLGKTFSGRHNNPAKENKTFIGKFFKRTRSYSVSPQLEKKTGGGSEGSKRFNRNSLRSSIRSNPEVVFKDNNRSSSVGRYTASMENLDKAHERTDQMNRSESFCYSPYSRFDHNNRSPSIHAIDKSDYDCTPPSQHNIQKSASCYGFPSQRSMPTPHDTNNEPFFTTNQHSPCRAKANHVPVSVPHSPSAVLDLARFQHLHITNNQQTCDCQQCLYNDYLDYLEFQRFRRYYSSQNCCGPCCTTHAVPHHQPMGARAQPCFQSRDPLTERSDILAPLPIIKDTEKEAKHLKTSKYESFV